MNNHISVDDQLKQIITPSGKSVYHLQLQRARITAIVLAMAAVMSLIFVVFAFVQKAAADQAREQAITNETRAEQNAAIAQKLQIELQQCRQLTTK